MGWKLLAGVLFAYGVVMGFAAFTRNRTMITLARAKFGVDRSDRDMVRVMYVSAVGLFVGGAVVSYFAFG